MRLLLLSDCSFIQLCLVLALVVAKRQERGIDSSVWEALNAGLSLRKYWWSDAACAGC